MVSSDKATKVLRERFPKFLELLRLQEWDIDLDIGNVGDGQCAVNNIKPYYLTSVITINPNSHDTIEDLIHSLLHEMVHLWFKEFAQMRMEINEEQSGEVRHRLIQCEEATVSRICRTFCAEMPDVIFGKWRKD